MILLIDNFDSFTYNIYQYLGILGAKVKVVRNNAITPQEALALEPTHIVISPGPGYPKDAGVTLDIITDLAGKVPILGVCLGHQAIGQAFGGKVVQAAMPMHGKQSQIYHNKSGIYRGLPSPFMVTRYHSLVIDRNTLPSCLTVSAYTEDGTIMGVRHKRHPIEGVQFHPESYMTEHGLALIKNFISRKK